MLVLVVNTVLFSIFLVCFWRYFFYIVDYYIYKGLKELIQGTQKSEIPCGICKNN